MQLIQEARIHSSWQPFLTESIVNQLHSIALQLTKGTAYTPPSPQVLRFMEFPLPRLRAIILGQDPYPQAGAATGRAFEVGHLTSWHQAFRNTSLQNIVRAAVEADYGHLWKFSEIRAKLGKNLSILPPRELFDYWEEQGVLMLNTSFSCGLNQPNSHSAIWIDFTRSLLTFLASYKAETVWFLWGEPAKRSVESLKGLRKVERYHPSRCYPRSGDFLFSGKNVFKESNLSINWTGYSSR